MPASERSSASKYAGKIEKRSRRTLTPRLRRLEGCHQSGAVGDDDPTAGYVDLGDERGHERHEGGPAVDGPHLEDVLGAVHDTGHLADDRAVQVHDAQTDQLVVVELLGVLGGLLGVEVGEQQGAAGPLGGVAVGELGEPHQQRGLVPARETISRLVSPLAEPGRRLGRERRTGAKRRSGSSVRTSTVTSPRRPWGLPMRPTTTSMRSVSTLGV